MGLAKELKKETAGVPANINNAVEQLGLGGKNDIQNLIKEMREARQNLADHEEAKALVVKEREDV